MNPISRFCVSLCSGLILVSSALALSSPNPTYNPTSQVIQGNEPLVAGSAALNGTDPFTLVITAPNTTYIPASAYPLTITLAVRNTGFSVTAQPVVPVPNGGNAAAALGYCTLSSPTVTFSAPNTTATVIVSVNVPAGPVAGDYYWNVYGTNWPSTSVVDLGGTINAIVAPPTISLNALPVIPVSSFLPANGANFIIPSGSTSVPVPISFTATCVSTAIGGSTISTLDAQIDTTTLIFSTTTGIQSPALPDLTYSASGSVTPSITNSGPHTITVSATNAAGTTTATTQINIYAPPTFTSAAATTFTYGQAGTYTVIASGYTAPTFAVTTGTLPAGVTLNSTTGVLSGTPTSGVGSYPFTITATNSLVDSTGAKSVGTATQNFTLTVVPAPLTITAANKVMTYGALVPALSATYSGFGNGDTSVVVSGLVLNTTATSSSPTGTYPITAVGAIAANYVITLVPGTMTVNPAGEAITFGALTPVTFGAAPITLGATANSGLPVSYSSSNPAVATVSGSTVTIIAGGTTTITASQAGNTNYSAATPVAQTLLVNPTKQTIAFGPLASVQTGAAPIALTATASSGLAVSYSSSNPAVATVSGSTVTIVGAGTTTITASQTGNNNYSAAASVPQSLTVTPVAVTPTLAWSNPAAITYGTALSSTQLNATATYAGVAVAGTYVYGPASGTILSAGTQTLTVTFTPSNSANYGGPLTASVSLVVNPATQTIIFGPLPSVVVGTASYALTATGGGSGNAVTYTSSNSSVATVSGSTITIVGAGTANIAANQAGNTNYLAATAVIQTLTVTAAGKPHKISGVVFFDTNYDGDFDTNKTCHDAYTNQLGCNDDGWGGYSYDQNWSGYYGQQWGGGSYSNRLCGNSNNWGWNFSFARDSESSHTSDIGLVGVTVQLLNSANQVVATTVTDSTGAYSFANVLPGSYYVLAVPLTGLKATTPNDVAVSISLADVVVAQIGFGLDFSALQKLPASCKTQSYWRSNLDNTFSSWWSWWMPNFWTLTNYTNCLSNAGTGVFAGISPQAACSLLKSNSNNSSDQLAQSLLAAEYNYSAGNYISGNQHVTYLFIWWGECVLTNPSRYNASYQAWTKNWFDAYNNCTGKSINGPSS